MKAADIISTPVNLYQTTCHHIPEVSHVIISSCHVIIFRKLVMSSCHHIIISCHHIPEVGTDHKQNARNNNSRFSFSGSFCDNVLQTNPSSRSMVFCSTQPLTEMSTRNLPGNKGRPARKSDNLAAICEPIV
jgi:hypothetical protein